MTDSPSWVTHLWRDTEMASARCVLCSDVLSLLCTINFRHSTGARDLLQFFPEGTVYQDPLMWFKKNIVVDTWRGKFTEYEVRKTGPKQKTGVLQVTWRGLLNAEVLVWHFCAYLIAPSSVYSHAGTLQEYCQQNSPGFGFVKATAMCTSWQYGVVWMLFSCPLGPAGIPFPQCLWLSCQGQTLILNTLNYAF